MGQQGRAEGRCSHACGVRQRLPLPAATSLQVISALGAEKTLKQLVWTLGLRHLGLARGKTAPLPQPLPFFSWI